jgi:hypothetical protein
MATAHSAHSAHSATAYTARPAVMAARRRQAVERRLQRLAELVRRGWVVVRQA